MFPFASRQVVVVGSVKDKSGPFPLLYGFLLLLLYVATSVLSVSFSYPTDKQTSVSEGNDLRDLFSAVFVVAAAALESAQSQ